MVDCFVNNNKVGYTDNYNGHGWLFNYKVGYTDNYNGHGWCSVNKVVTVVIITGMDDCSVKLVTLIVISNMIDCSVNKYKVGYTDDYNRHSWLICK